MPAFLYKANRSMLKRCCGALISIMGLVVLGSMLSNQLHSAGTHVQDALTGGCIAAAATALGTLPVLLAQRFSQRSYDAMLGFGAGVMLGATAFSLIVPALAAARASGASQAESSIVVGAGILSGGVLIMLLDRLISHDPGELAARSATSVTTKGAWMFVTAVALHNVPEGLAIGVAYAGQDLQAARTVATAISIQDVPEGLVVALALRSAGYGRLSSSALGAASGVVELVAAMFGVIMISMATDLLPLGLAIAAGAMLLVIVHSVIPESHRHGNTATSSMALLGGFTLMTVLDTMWS